jgi:hypothetical protein
MIIESKRESSASGEERFGSPVFEKATRHDHAMVTPRQQQLGSSIYSESSSFMWERFGSLIVDIDWEHLCISVSILVWLIRYIKQSYWKCQ